jgi:hypothetical protein
MTGGSGEKNAVGESFSVMQASISSSDCRGPQYREQICTESVGQTSRVSLILYRTVVTGVQTARSL